MFVKSKILRSKHAFATRNGGVSTLEHTKSLNLAFGRGDEKEIVLENLKIFANEVGFAPEQVISLPQIHSNMIYKVGEENCGEGYFKTEDIREGDGYITGKKGVVLGIKTADCVPILFEAEKDGKIVAVGAVHAGWRGTVAKIAPKCARSLCDEYGVAAPARDEFVGHSAGKLTNAYRDLSDEYLLREGSKLNALIYFEYFDCFESRRLNQKMQEIA